MIKEYHLNLSEEEIDDELLNLLFLEDMEWQDNERKIRNLNQLYVMDS